ncbi:MAG: M28 family peptidase [Candidatus Eisenbacteria bacterium]|nr:M28 family peptidase [Candidatus Eisenbacteria bacterium]
MITCRDFRALPVAVLFAAAFTALAAGTAPAATPAQPIPAAVTAAAGEIAGGRLHADVAFLADDLLEGRGTATRGYDLAAAYVAARMAALGLEPAGDSLFHQRVPLRRAVLDEERTTLSLVRGEAEQPLALGRDALVQPDFLREVWSTDAPIVFAGFGVSAPELGHDDFAELDVRGKVVVEFRGAPPRFPHDERAYYSHSLVKEQAAVSRGAVGILQVLKPADQVRQPWDRTRRQSRLPRYRWVDEGGAPANVQALLELSARLSPDGVAAVFAGAPKSFGDAATAADSGQAGGFDLEPRVRARVVTRQSAAASANVLGLLRGSDPRLANEAIVVSAHLDHLGIGQPVDGDSIYNGAYDNASGTAMMLEVARAFTRLRIRPRRSILFVALTGEENGLQGSDFLARRSAPAGLDLVGDINLDMILMLNPLTRVVAIGAEHSSLGPVLERAARLAGLAVVPDPSPEEVVFVRSDQFSFVKQGVPAIFPVSGDDGTPEAAEAVRKWREERYHAPGDDLAQPFDWEGGARFTRMAFLAAWLAADAPQAPRWIEGDFFGRRFGARR